jgi:hypothetical protein
MRPLSGHVLLEAWEQAVAQPEISRSLALLEAGLPEAERTQLEALPVNECNRMLVQLHRESFGVELEAVAICPACRVQVEFSVAADELVALAEGHGSTEEVEWTEDGSHYRLRAVTMADLIASLGQTETEAAEDALLSRCLVVEPSDAGVRPSSLPGVLERFEQLHAGSEFLCALECPSCSTPEVLDLDIGRFLWTEVRRAATRLLGDVHTLAAAYGWSEQAILDLSAGRRAAYLELVGA